MVGQLDFYISDINLFACKYSQFDFNIAFFWNINICIQSLLLPGILNIIDRLWNEIENLCNTLSWSLWCIRMVFLSIAEMMFPWWVFLLPWHLLAYFDGFSIEEGFCFLADWIDVILSFSQIHYSLIEKYSNLQRS